MTVRRWCSYTTPLTERTGTNNANWLTERPIREWHGVTNDASGRVTRLLLDSNGLAGEIPKELGSLSNLKKTGTSVTTS